MAHKRKGGPEVLFRPAMISVATTVELLFPGGEAYAFYSMGFSRWCPLPGFPGPSS